MGTIQHGMLQVGGNRAWLLGLKGDRSKSAVWTTPNVFATSPAWSKGDDLDGVYTLIRPSDATLGKVLAYSPASTFTGWQKTLNFKLTDGGFANVSGGGYDPTGIWTVGDGWVQSQGFQGPISVWDRGVNVFLGSLPSHTLTYAKMGFNYHKGNINDGISSVGVALRSNVDFLILEAPSDTSNGDNQVLTWLGSQAGVTSYTFWLICDRNADPSTFFGSATGLSLVLRGTGTCPFATCDGPGAGSGDAFVAASMDDGATWATPIDLGTSPGPVGGFDVQHGGTVSYAAIQGAVKKASTLGGAYSSYASFGTNPILIEVPWGTKNSRSPNSGSSPQVIVGLDAPDSGKTLLWFVGGSPVDITPVISGNPGIPVGANCLCTWLGLYLALIATFGGSQHLVTSINGGSTWRDCGPIDATYLRLRRLAKTPGQLYAAGDTLEYSGTFGNSLVGRTKPSADPLQFFEPYG